MRLRTAYGAWLVLVAGGPVPWPGQGEGGREFTPVFDGATLGGWDGDDRFWRVEGGAIVGESTQQQPCERSTYLVWRGGEPADFELALSFRIRSGNSGVQFRSRAPSAEEAAGYQADLEAGDTWTGGLYEQDGRGVLARRGERVVFDASGERTAERFADGEALLARIDRDGWNEMRIFAFGPRLTVSIDGEISSEVIDLDPERAARRGSIALQLHAGPPMRVEFRDLRLRRLGEEIGDEAEPVPSPWSVSGDPRWIWADVSVRDGQVAWFRRSFELSSAPRRAELWASADNHFEAWLNGERAAAGDDWMRPERVDVSGWLRAGRNELAVRARNDGGPAALSLVLEVELEGGGTFLLASDESWRATTREPRRDWMLEEPDWPAARSFGSLDASPWGEVRDSLGGTGEAISGDEIEVPPGFRAQLLHPVAPDSEGSWISLAVDPAGRLYASDQYGGLFRIVAARIGSTEEARVEPIDVPLGEAHGLLWAFDSLYAVVSGAGRYASGLYRARDTDGDDGLDEVDLLARLDGSGEHGPHAVLLHPDGRSLVVVGGNHCRLPARIERYRLPRHWGEDVLLPPLPDPNGHAVGIRAPGGWIARTDPDGESWELIAGGFRNPYDAAFSAEGELFTFDADMEWDVGLPWYRPTRILHVTSGADFGWRSGSAKWPADSFDALPSAVDLGLSSPTGVVFGTETNFPPPWDRALFACDWAYGKIFAVFLEPEGSTFHGRAEVFAAGRPFPVTDLVVGVDGALYVTTGGRRTQSGLYRIAWEGAAIPAAAATGSPEAEAARELRRRLEEFHGVRADEAVPLALSGLRDPDRFVRYAARIALEHQDPRLWSEAVLAERDPRAALEGLLALVRAGPDAESGAVIDRAAGILEGSADETLCLDALRVLDLALIRLAPPEETKGRLRDRLDPFYPSGIGPLDRALIACLVHLEAPGVAERALARMEEAESQEERIWIAYALRALRSGWTPESERRFSELLDAEVERVRGGESARGYVGRIREEAAAILGIEPLAAPPTAEDGSVAISSRTAGGGLGEGERLYRKAGCHECHRFEGEGESRGPDLTGVGARFSARDLLVAIREPSREVPDVWADTEFWGEGDDLLAVGRLLDESTHAFVVETTSGERLSLPRGRVVERRAHPLSRMPEGLLDGLSEEEVLRIIEFLRGLNSPPR